VIEAKVTISPGLGSALEQLQQLGQDDIVMRKVATTLLADVHDRIHEEGRDVTGGQIGTYGQEYMKVRTGDFGNSKRFVRGKNKGQPKDSGVFTKGKNKGQPRPNYNRTSDTKVVASLTRQMENDFKVVATEDGYGLGYSNEENFNKAGYVEKTYGKEIFGLTAREEDLAIQIAADEIMKIFNS
jgi:phage gpG-like protein